MAASDSDGDDGDFLLSCFVLPLIIHPNYVEYVIPSPPLLRHRKSGLTNYPKAQRTKSSRPKELKASLKSRKLEVQTQRVP